MTYPGVNATNVAGDQTTVGLQAETIHGDVYSYVMQPGDSAEQEYEVGVNYLDGGVPSAALARIEQAIAKGHDTSEVRFYWLLALISGRTSRQFSPEDTARLDRLRQHPVVCRSDPWAEGIRVILRLLDSLRETGVGPGPFISALDDLPPQQRGPVLRHLAVFLTGPLGDEVWKLEHKAAIDGRHAWERAERVGLFFQPSPAKPRTRQPVPAAISSRDRVTTFIGAVVAVLVLADIGWQLLRHGSVAGMTGYAVGCAGCYLAIVNWIELRWEARRRAEQALLAPGTRSPAPVRGFAASVDRRFDHYLAVRVPHGTKQEDWISATAGVRQRVRDEIVEIYREERIRDGQLDWLIRYEVESMARRWRAGTLYSSDDEYSARPGARIARAAGVTASALGAILAAWALLHVDPVGGLLALALLTASGYRAELSWTRTALERRRAAADQDRSERKFAERDAAYQAWTGKLSHIKPTDQEMAVWLDCDKKIILEHALQRYGLKRSDVIAYATLETPGDSYRRASVRNGPWRYTQCKILVFLLTRDGIRQIAYSLRTRDSFIEELDRESYGYNAIVSVQASAPKDKSDYRQTFHLHLVGGRTFSFRVADPVSQSSPEDSDASLLDNATQDATGLRNTLRVLEGIAADGKGWISRETL